LCRFQCTKLSGICYEGIARGPKDLESLLAFQKIEQNGNEAGIEVSIGQYFIFNMERTLLQYFSCLLFGGYETNVVFDLVEYRKSKDES